MMDAFNSLVSEGRYEPGENVNSERIQYYQLYSNTNLVIQGSSLFNCFEMKQGPLQASNMQQIRLGNEGNWWDGPIGVTAQYS